MINENGLKRCSKCQQWLELECFGKDRKRKDGLSGQCRSCRKRNSTILKEKRRANGFKCCPKCKQWLEFEHFCKNKNKKDNLSSYCRECCRLNRVSYSKKNKEIIKERTKQYYKKNKEILYERTKQWRKENKEKSDAIYARYRKTKKRKIVLKKYQESELGKRTGANRSQRRRARLSQCETFVILDKEIRRLRNSPCNVCGSKENIHLDHIIPITRNGRHSIGNLQPLCQHCNCSKNDKLMAEWRYGDLRKYSQLS